MKLILLIGLFGVCSVFAGSSSKGEGSSGVLSFLSSVSQTVLGSNCVEPPNECPNVNVTFWYYTKSTQDNPVKLTVGDDDSFEKLEKNENPWKIIIHGYTKSKDKIPNPELRSAYFEKGDYNIISVDYEPIARDKCYVAAAKNVHLIANCTSQFIDTLVEKKIIDMKNLHVIGFSLGGQIAGRLVNFLESGVPNRVTELDPASPLFAGLINGKIDESAGEFVDAIHTNGLFKGKIERTGHVDFYVNGGLRQPGCSSNNDDESSSTCSHNRSPRYFAESINATEGFWGVPCSSLAKYLMGLCKAKEEDLVIMGEYTPHTARGSYYLETNSEAPFARGKLF